MSKYDDPLDVLNLILLMMEQSNPAIFDDYYTGLLKTAIHTLKSPK